MSDWVGIVWLVVLLLVNAFFVGAEFALVSARRAQIEPRAQQGSRAAKTVLWAMENVNLMLATCQLGITVCSLLILNVSEPAIHHLIAVVIPAGVIDPVVVNVFSFFLALALVSFLHVVFGEMVPKNLAFSLPERAVLILGRPLVWIAQIVRPVTGVLGLISNGVVRLCGVKPKNEAASTFTLDEVTTIVANSREQGVLDDTTGTVAAVLDFMSKTAQNIAVPVDQIMTLSVSATPEDIEKAVAEYGFSRFVIVDSQKKIIGYVHLKDILRAAEPGPGSTGFAVPIPSSRIHRMAVVQTTTELEDALAMMRSSGCHLARVRNSRGVTVGVLFLEDVIEELVGEVHDATQDSAST